jgi:hypothetical protein
VKEDTRNARRLWIGWMCKRKPSGPQGGHFE